MVGWLEKDLLEVLDLADPQGSSIASNTGAQIRNSQNFQNFLIHVGSRMEKFTDVVISHIQSQTPLFYELGLVDGASFVAEQLEVTDSDLDLIGLILAETAERYDTTTWDPYGSGWTRFKSLTPATLDALNTQVPMSLGLDRGRNPTKAAIRGFQKVLGNVAGWLTNMGNLAVWGSYVQAMFGLMRGKPYLSDWLWVATLDHKVCASCISLHCSRHPFYEQFFDHPHGRCMPIPLVTEIPRWVGDRSYEIRHPVVGSGEEWFTTLDSQIQRDILGKSMYNAWKDGAVSLQDMSVRVDNPAYGTIARRASVAELLGDGARQYYDR